MILWSGLGGGCRFLTREREYDVTRQTKGQLAAHLGGSLRKSKPPLGSERLHATRQDKTRPAQESSRSSGFFFLIQSIKLDGHDLKRWLLLFVCGLFLSFLGASFWACWGLDWADKEVLRSGTRDGMLRLLLQSSFLRYGTDGCVAEMVVRSS